MIPRSCAARSTGHVCWPRRVRPGRPDCVRYVGRKPCPGRDHLSQTPEPTSKRVGAHPRGAAPRPLLPAHSGFLAACKAQRRPLTSAHRAWSAWPPGGATSPTNSCSLQAPLGGGPWPWARIPHQLRHPEVSTRLQACPSPGQPVCRRAARALCQGLSSARHAPDPCHGRCSGCRWVSGQPGPHHQVSSPPGAGAGPTRRRAGAWRWRAV